MSAGTSGWRSAVARFDQRADELLEPLRGNANVDRAFGLASHLADWSLLWHLSGATRGLLDDARADEAFRLSAALAVESMLVNQGVKRLFRRTRPDGHEAGLHTYGLRRPTTSSFPSGHASSAFCAAVLLSRGGRSRTTPLWFAAAALVGSSRVVVRAHHASDVVGGAALGTVLGVAARRVWRLPGA